MLSDIKCSFEDEEHWAVNQKAIPVAPQLLDYMCALDQVNSLPATTTE